MNRREAIAGMTLPMVFEWTHTRKTRWQSAPHHNIRLGVWKRSQNAKKWEAAVVVVAPDSGYAERRAVIAKGTFDTHTEGMLFCEKAILSFSAEIAVLRDKLLTPIP